MVKVTSKDYYLDGFAEQVCQAIAKRVTERNQDLLCIMNGQEGSGKTNAAVALAYRIADITGREFSNEQIFFDIAEMMKYAGNNKEKIIIWDEAALGGLANSWSSFYQKKLLQMLMICRKLKHIFFFCVPRFYRLRSDIIERAYCMFHIYENKQEVPGNFMFYGRESLEYIYSEWKKNQRANYWKYKKLHGHFLWVLPKLIDEDKYEKNKDLAIQNLVNEKKENDGDTKLQALMKQRMEYAEKIYYHYKNFAKVARIIGVDKSTIRDWAKKGGWRLELSKNSSLRLPKCTEEEGDNVKKIAAPIINRA